MSLVYAALTTKRETPTPVTSSDQSPTGLKSYIDVFAALVPAEVLAAHAFVLSFTTSTDKNNVTTITQPGTLQWVFFALLGLSIVLYVAGRYKSWEGLDFVRVFIPPLAFVGWTMLEKTTAFDAVWPSMNPATRTALAVIGAIVLAAIAALLTFPANAKAQAAAKAVADAKAIADKAAAGQAAADARAIADVKAVAEQAITDLKTIAEQAAAATKVIARQATDNARAATDAKTMAEQAADGTKAATEKTDQGNEPELVPKEGDAPDKVNGTK